MINAYNGTSFDSTVELSNDNNNLETFVTFGVTITNKSTYLYSYFDTLYMESLTPPIIDTTTFNTNPICFVPCGALNAYQHSDWATYMESIEEYNQAQYAEEIFREIGCDGELQGEVMELKKKLHK